jgi:hypothetical protein
LCSTGITGAAIGTLASLDASFSAAGRISELWNGADTGKQHAALRALCVADSIARSTASLWPAITICSGPLKLTGSTTRPEPIARTVSAQTAATAAASSPRIAAIAPTPDGTACCIASARKRTSGTASRNASAPRQRAPYIRRGCVRRRIRLRAARLVPRAPHRNARREHHRLRVDGLAEIGLGSFGDERPQILAENLGRLVERRANGGCASKPAIIPTACEPCPGKTNAMRMSVNIRGTPRPT